MNKRISNRLKILAVVGIMSALSIGGIRAYMTDRQEAANEFTVGKVDFNLYETGWDGEMPDGSYIATPSDALGVNQAKNLYSGQIISKDPAVKNNSKNDAYVRLQVKVPVAQVIVADEEGNILNNGLPMETELFTYEENENSGMRRVSQTPTLEIASSGDATRAYHVYEYAYTGGGDAEIALPAGQDIPPLFDNVVFANIVDGEIEGKTEFIHVQLKAIQAGGFDSAQSAWDAYARQNPQTN